MIHGLNEAIQKETYLKIKSFFGDYNDLKFESIMMFHENLVSKQRQSRAS